MLSRNHLAVLVHEVAKVSLSNLQNPDPTTCRFRQICRASGSGRYGSAFFGQRWQDQTPHFSPLPQTVFRLTHLDDISVSETQNFDAPSLLAVRCCSLSPRYFQPTQPREILAADTHPSPESQGRLAQHQRGLCAAPALGI